MDEKFTLFCRNLDGNNLRAVSSHTFDFLPKLQTLYLAENELLTLPEDIFAHNPDLERVSLAGNVLERLPNNIFPAKLTHLQSLDLSNNNICSVLGLIEAKLPALESLDLHKNRLDGLDPNWPNTLTGLKQLDVSENELFRLPNLGGFRLLEDFRAKKNHLSMVKMVSFVRKYNRWSFICSLIFRFSRRA